ncbi:protein TIC 20-I, chloroplastic-like isoform X2 [Phragmites australis]|uniref:protein TIC 20-I, chloroplastic-like isoform X2 n=1 Tax=Phragmites australis TaxID=29695 RepID=UPI002D773802|nr:protein TIC 20-I, chloroplastic-like isoform X2 [Phragmites australis]
MMFPCQGVATANARPFGIPAVSRYGSPARPSSRAKPAFLSLRGPAFRHENKSFASRDFHCHAISSSFAKYDPIKGIKPLLSARRLCPRTQVCCQASLSSFSYPELSSKPRWWWRTLACVPYLLPLHNMWSHADAIYHLHPYLQRFGLLYAFIDTMALLPGWLFLVIFMTIYFFVVRQKWSPHFLRFHIILAILLDTGSQALATACNWNPSIVFQGKPMAYFWMTMAFIQIFTVLECMRCALSGVYPNVPFISHAAFIHSDLNLFR